MQTNESVVWTFPHSEHECAIYWGRRRKDKNLIFFQQIPEFFSSEYRIRWQELLKPALQGQGERKARTNFVGYASKRRSTPRAVALRCLNRAIDETNVAVGGAFECRRPSVQSYANSWRQIFITDGVRIELRPIRWLRSEIFRPIPRTNKHAWRSEHVGQRQNTWRHSVTVIIGPSPGCNANFMQVDHALRGSKALASLADRRNRNQDATNSKHAREADAGNGEPFSFQRAVALVDL